jgi:hypothetical protein
MSDEFEDDVGADEDDDDLEEQPARIFALEEASALLPAVTPLLESLRAANDAMESRSEAVMESVPTNGGGAVHREFIDASRQAGRALDALNEMGVIVRDPATGLIDFPAMRDEDIVFLCWRLGEDAIAWWHPTDTGFAGREPL